MLRSHRRERSTEHDERRYDRDGNLDVLLVRGSTVEQYEKGGSFLCELFRGDGRGRFQEVTRQAGIQTRGWGMGVVGFQTRSALEVAALAPVVVLATLATQAAVDAARRGLSVLRAPRQETTEAR